MRFVEFLTLTMTEIKRLCEFMGTDILQYADLGRMLFVDNKDFRIENKRTEKGSKFFHGNVLKSIELLLEMKNGDLKFYIFQKKLLFFLNLILNRAYAGTNWEANSEYLINR